MANGFYDVVVGLQYGDEGKARIVDSLADQYDIVARFNGGANAGHTVQSKGVKLALAQIPCGVLHGDKILYIGSGCLLSLKKLKDELDALSAIGIDLEGRFLISPFCSVVQPHQIALDLLDAAHLGTTGNGMGPAYADRARRAYQGCLLNIRFGELLSKQDKMLAQMRANWHQHANSLETLEFDLPSYIEQTAETLEALNKYVAPHGLYLQEQLQKGARVVFEGAQSVMLDVARGTVPYVTASHTFPSYACCGGDVSPKFCRKIIGVAKAIMSRVGHGPFPSELGGRRSEEYCMLDAGKFNTREKESLQYNPRELLQREGDFELGIALRMLCGEYGTKTGRPRRIGMLDLVQLRYAVNACSVDQLFLNRCDLLPLFSKSQYEAVPVVTAYSSAQNSIGTGEAELFSYTDATNSVELFESFDINELSKHSLPEGLQALVNRIEVFCGCSARGLGIGPDREEIHWRSSVC